MNAAETIAAAIQKLEQERVASSPTGETWRALDSITGEYSTIRATSAGVTVLVASGLMREDAVLIVTLHRTIDAQLAILRDAKAAYEKVSGLDLDWGLELDLARAILGEDT